MASHSISPFYLSIITFILMSSDIVDLASPQPSPKEAVINNQMISGNPDVEMTTLLTLNDDSVSSSLYSVKSETMSSFQTAKERLNRINCNVNGNGNGNGTTRPAAATVNTPSTNTQWRREVSASVSNSSSSNHSRSALTNAANRPRSRSLYAGMDNIPISMVKPGPVWPTEIQLRFAYAYGIRRENGTYTRLIPADELDRPYNSTVPSSQGPEGLIVLPLPHLAHPESHENSGNEEMIPMSVSLGMTLFLDLSNISRSSKTCPRTSPVVQAFVVAVVLILTTRPR